MERNYTLNDENLAATISVALGLNYQFLPHDRVVSINSRFEKLEFSTDLEFILSRIALRDGMDWFHLVKSSWQIVPFSTSRVRNNYRGEMDFVDQRSWGPYVDFQVRKPANQIGQGNSEIQIHLYPKFWLPQTEQEIQTPASVVGDYRQLCEAVEKLK